MWSYSTAEYDPIKLSTDVNILATGGGIQVGDLYYFNRYMEMMGFEEIKTFSYNIADWTEYDSYTGKINYVATTMAYSPLRDEAYGCFINEERNGYTFTRWRYKYYQPQRVICDLERPWSGCAFSSDGTLYAIEQNGDLYTVNLKNGAMTLVGSTGVSAPYTGDAVIDPATDTMYWCAATENSSALYAVDITNATATKVYDLPNAEQLCGMYIPTTVAYADGAPAAISSTPGFSFSGTSLEGTVSFYTPTRTVAGETLDAETELDYAVYANGVEVATGKALPGKRVSAQVTLTKADNYYFTVTTSNEAGTSPAKGDSKFVGPDEPKAPTTFNATIKDGNVNLSWSIVPSTGINGGSVNYTEAKFKVVRYPDMKVVAEDLTNSTRTATDELPTPEVRTEYYYVLSSTVDGVDAPDVKSASFKAGAIDPEETLDFTTALSMAGWTIADANEDDYKWGFYSYSKVLQISTSRGFDDWAITPAVKVKAGTSYPVTITVSSSSRNETVEVFWGTEPTVEAMTNELIEESTFQASSSSPVEFSGDLSAAESGIVYIGIHACTPSPSSTINLHSIKIASGETATAPAAPGNFKAESPVDGTCQATISFTLPTKCINGEEITEETALTKVEILRDEEVIETLTEDLTPGTEIEYVDNSEDLTLGKHVYAAVAYNSHGDGAMAQAELLVGANRPAAPASARFVEDGNTGKVTISWDSVTEDFQGNTIKPEAITYKIIDRGYNVIGEGVTGTSFVYQAVDEGDQAFVQFGVYAVTVGGESAMAPTAYKPAGTAYRTPWAESFANKQVSSIFGFNYIKGQEPWQFISIHEDAPAVPGPQDADGGFAFLEAYGDLTALVTGKIDLEGLFSPAFTYYTYNYSSGSVYTNALEVQVDNGDGRGFVTVQKDVVAETGPVNEWNKVSVDLSEYDGQTVILRIVPTDLGLAMYTLDNLRVGSNVDYNLAITRLDAPNVVDVNKPYEVSVWVNNSGLEAVNSYVIELYNGEEMIDFKELGAIEPAATKEIVFEVTHGIHEGEYVNIHAELVCNQDEVEEDNVSETATIGVAVPNVPVARSLSIKSSNDGHELTWAEPDMYNAAPAPYTESFEEAESWSSAVNDWKFVDMDKAPVGGINTPNFPVNGLKSWYVADCTWSGFPEEGAAAWKGHTGNKLIGSSYAMMAGQNVQSDDWAITPRLLGETQAISLYAKSFYQGFLESFEVLASDGTTSVEDFKSVGMVYDVPLSWTLYRFMLPEGTKYAAIRSRSINKHQLFIDDVTFIPSEGEAAVLEHIGYHVYRNNVRLTSAPIQATSFVDTDANPARTHSYFVTAVYDKGESRPSNRVESTTTGVDSFGDDSNVTITAVDGGVVVKNLAKGEVVVYSVDGRVIARVAASARVKINLAPSIYIVKAGQKVAKVIVK